MTLSHPIEPVLHLVKLKDLRPTQMTVGMREVERKRALWRDRERSGAGEFLGAHMIPAVLGPDGHHWLVDHHHLALALHLEGVEDILVTLVVKLERLPKKRFLAYMDARNWLHPYDEHGRRRDWKDLPRHLGKLADASCRFHA